MGDKANKIKSVFSWIREIMIPGGQSHKQIARNMGLTLMILGAASLLCSALNAIASGDDAVPMIFVLAVLLTARFTDGYFYSFFATIASVVAVNYVFTYPYFAFNFTITGYPLTFLTMFSVSMVVGMLTEQVKRHGRIEAEAEKEKMKANLLRSVSHDLRTPLTSIIGSSSAVLENYDALSDEIKKDLIENVRSDAEWLVRLVENILSVTRIKEGAVKIRKNDEAAEEIAAEAVAKFRKRFDTLPVQVRVPDELMIVPMDAMLIEQVLINMMENVVLHARGATKMTLSIRIKDDMAVFAVEDDGMGIDEEILPKLFKEVFTHAERRSGDEHRSMGIGLSACMSVIMAHGGDMRAENLPGGGACVSFTLPMREETNYGSQR